MPIGVITGATTGIGRASALALAQRGFDLVLIGRHRRRGELLASRLARRHSAGKFEFVRCDLSSLGDVRRAAAAIQSGRARIDVLINNAGARFDKYAVSVDGIELTFATNHLGHFLLTALLWPSLVAGHPARIITVSSGAHRAAGLDGGWLMPAEAYDRRQAYARSKLANILFAFELARRARATAVVSNAVDPGVLATQFARNNGVVAWARHVIPHFLRGQLTSVGAAAEAMARLAVAPDLAHVSGRLFCHGRIAAPAPPADDPALAAGLWTESLRLTGLEATHPFAAAQEIRVNSNIKSERIDNLGG